MQDRDVRGCVILEWNLHNWHGQMGVSSLIAVFCRILSREAPR